MQGYIKSPNIWVCMALDVFSLHYNAVVCQQGTELHFNERDMSGWSKDVLKRDAENILRTDAVLRLSNCHEAETSSSATPDFAECESTLDTPQKPHSICYTYHSEKTESGLAHQHHNRCQLYTVDTSSCSTIFRIAVRKARGRPETSRMELSISFPPVPWSTGQPTAVQHP